MADNINILKEFYNICNNNRINTNFDIFDNLVKLQDDNQDIVSVFWCDNDSFSSSIIVSIKINDSRVALFYLDAYNCDIIRINFSYHRFQNFAQTLIKVSDKLIPEIKK